MPRRKSALGTQESDSALAIVLGTVLDMKTLQSGAPPLTVGAIYTFDAAFGGSNVLMTVDACAEVGRTSGSW